MLVVEHGPLHDNAALVEDAEDGLAVNRNTWMVGTRQRAGEY